MERNTLRLWSGPPGHTLGARLDPRWALCGPDRVHDHEGWPPRTVWPAVTRTSPTTPGISLRSTVSIFIASTAHTPAPASDGIAHLDHHPHHRPPASGC